MPEIDPTHKHRTTLQRRSRTTEFEIRGVVTDFGSSTFMRFSSLWCIVRRRRGSPGSRSRFRRWDERSVFVEAHARRGGPDTALSVWVAVQQEVDRVARRWWSLLCLRHPDVQSHVWATPPLRDLMPTVLDQRQ